MRLLVALLLPTQALFVLGVALLTILLLHRSIIEDGFSGGEPRRLRRIRKKGAMVMATVAVMNLRSCGSSFTPNFRATSSPCLHLRQLSYISGWLLFCRWTHRSRSSLQWKRLHWKVESEASFLIAILSLQIGHTKGSQFRHFFFFRCHSSYRQSKQSAILVPNLFGIYPIPKFHWITCTYRFPYVEGEVKLITFLTPFDTIRA